MGQGAFSRRRSFCPVLLFDFGNSMRSRFNLCTGVGITEFGFTMLQGTGSGLYIIAIDYCYCENLSLVN